MSNTEITFFSFPSHLRRVVEIKVTILNYLPLTKEYKGICNGEEITVDPYINNCIPNDKIDLQGEFIMQGEWYLGDDTVFLPSKIEEC